MKVNLNKDSLVYVLCPAGIKTGGTELSHQLVYILNQNSINAKMVYITDDSFVAVTKGFEEYITSALTLKDIVDDKKNLLVIPEGATYLCDIGKNIQKAIWWMSVDNYLKNASVLFALNNYGISQAVKTFVKYVTGKKKQISASKIPSIKYHFVQSEYARLFLKKMNVDSFWLSDYINESYYDVEFNRESKQNIILYNPAKGKEITEQIMKSYRGQGKWIPLVNLTNAQMREILYKAKVYIDFGPFPGKDRIPREAAISYCCVITGTKGASNNSVDLPISSGYKFDAPMKHIDEIVLSINDCLENYDTRIGDFENYRKTILNEKERFLEEIRDLFL